MPDIGTAIGAGVSLIGIGAAEDAADAQNNALANQNALTQLQAQIAREQWDFYKQNYQPLELDVLALSREAGTPEEQEMAAGRAVADVRQQFGISRGTTKRNLERMGLNPADPSYATLMSDSNLAEAAATASAANLARENERNLGYTKMIQAMSLGKGLPTEAAANLGRASAGYGNQASAYADKFNSAVGGTYGLVNAVSQMPWNKIFTQTPAPDHIGQAAATGNLGPPNVNPSDSGLVDLSDNYGSGFFREGGLVRGKGTGTSDSNLIHASKGEFVVPANIVKALGTDFFYDLIDKTEKKALGRRGPHGN